MHGCPQKRILLCLFAAACTTGAQNLVSDCNNLITLFENNPSLQKQAAGLNGASDAQIQAAINAVPNEKPSAT